MNAPRAEITAFVVAAVEDRDDDSAGDACVGEQAVTNVNAHMVRIRAVGGKEHKVCKLEVLPLNRRSERVLFVAGMRKPARRSRCLNWGLRLDLPLTLSQPV